MKILYIDIETMPNLGLVFDLWNQNLSLAQLVEPNDALCFAAFWDDAPNRPIFYSVWDDGHEAMVRAAWDLLDEADVVVHYNGRKFDIPWLQRLFVELGLSPPSPFRQVDLYRVVASQFRFPSNKLEFVAQRLLGTTKVKHEGFGLWVKVMARESSACMHMRRYCIKDTKLLIPLFHKLLPWIARIPNAAVFSDSTEPLCVACGSSNFHKEGLARTQTRLYQRYQCDDCGKWFRGVKSLGGVEVTETPLNN